MPLRSDWSDRPRPVARALDVLGDPWIVLVLRDRDPHPLGEAAGALPARKVDR